MDYPYGPLLWLSLGADWLIAARVYLGFCSMKHLPPGSDASPLQVTTPQQVSPTIIYSLVPIYTLRVEYLAQEHNTMFLTRVQTWTAHSRVQCTNQEATVPPTRGSPWTTSMHPLFEPLTK